MQFMLQIFHEIICFIAKTPIVTNTLQYFNSFFLILASNILFMLWFYKNGANFELSIRSLLRALLTLVAQYLFIQYVAIIPSEQSSLVGDLSGFLLSISTMLWGLEQYSDKSTIFLMINSIICVILHRNYLYLTFPWVVVATANNALFKYYNGDVDFVFSAFVYTVVVTGCISLYKLFYVSNLDVFVVSPSLIIYLLIYLGVQFLSRLTMIYSLKRNSTKVISVISLIRFVLIALITNGKINAIFLLLLTNAILSVIY